MPAMAQLFAFVLQLLLIFAAGSDHDGHDHGHDHGHDQGGDVPFEWAGVFSTPEDIYMWTAQKAKSVQ